MKKILCPVDASPAADNAIVYAAKIAKKTGATLELFNVQRLGDLTPEEAILGKDFNVAAATKAMEARAQEVTQVFKVSCDASVGANGLTLRKQINDAAEGSDLIVIGTNGEDDFNQTLFGSNTYRVVRSVDVPVLLVPEACGFSEIQIIGYAFDYLNVPEIPLTRVLALAKALACRVSVLQVVKQQYNHETEQKISEAQQKINAVYDDAELGFETIFTGDTAQAIHEFMLAGKADLLALCARNSKLITTIFDKSITHAISKKASYPVFTFYN